MTLPAKVYAASPVKQKRKRRTKEQMALFRDAIRRTLMNRNPQTVRQLFYQLVSQGVIEKTENQYDAVSVQSLKLREQGVIDWEWIQDTTRWVRAPYTYENVSEALDDLAYTYRLDYWRDQGCRVHIWSEKDALAALMEQVTDPLCVPLYVSRGFSSPSYILKAAKTIQERDVPTYVYYFGDHDPSGIWIDVKIE